jgi:hypothetical protein
MLKSNEGNKAWSVNKKDWKRYLQKEVSPQGNSAAPTAAY